MTLHSITIIASAEDSPPLSYTWTAGEAIAQLRTAMENLKQFIEKIEVEESRATSASKPIL